MASDGSPQLIPCDLVPERTHHSSTITVPTIEFLPQRVYIPKQLLLKQALQILSLKMPEIKASIVGNDQLLGSVCIDVPAHDGTPAAFQQKFFGDYSLTEEEALESASLAALTYLQKPGIIIVDDANLSQLRLCEKELLACQHKLLAASSYATMFQERAVSLQVELTVANQKFENENELAYTPSSEDTSTSSRLKPKNHHAVCKPKSQKVLFKDNCAAAS